MGLYLCWGLEGIFLIAPLVWPSVLLSVWGLKILGDKEYWKRHWKMLLS